MYLVAKDIWYESSFIVLCSCNMIIVLLRLMVDLTQLIGTSLNILSMYMLYSLIVHMVNDKEICQWQLARASSYLKPDIHNTEKMLKWCHGLHLNHVIYKHTLQFTRQTAYQWLVSNIQGLTVIRLLNTCILLCIVMLFDFGNWVIL